MQKACSRMKVDSSFSTRFLIATLGLFFIPTFAFAQVNPPTQSVWITPLDAKKGQTIEIKALIYNSNIKDVTLTVLFADAGEEIGTKSTLVEAQTAETVAVLWVFPDESREITVSVIKALDANKKNVPELLGVVGKINIGIDEVFSGSGVEGKLKGTLSTLFGGLDSWREKQAKHFLELRETTKQKLGIKVIKEIYDKLAPKPIEGPTIPGGGKEQTIGDVDIGYDDQAVPVGLYITLIYATAFAAILSSLALFYITFALLFFVVLRFLVRIFT